MDVNVWDCYPQVSGKRFYLINGKYVRDNDLIGEKSICLDEAIDTMNALNEENEQLKKELKDYHNAFDCSQCKYQNYDWFDDGDEFEVCDKGNNEAQMDNHSCTDWVEL